ncbi:WxL domain-containing protein [Enterococcus sp. 669A]|uniref:WxL domain-containing protein n=1 Tax=Candidatus Enterococcus moelleringii TaxID=2815325 RepID=A0ABS3LFS5_9ENTE|nr:WxL domain-containing protein [Enterococcus sp. 669A]MBO1308480.1 WxL domain-containing protein [Enterococcus sp. 669A]
MKKTRLLISAVVLGGMVTAGSLPAMAEEVVNTHDGKATVQFTENTDTPGIVDPTNPEEPLVPQVPVDDPDNEGTNNPGPLSLDVFPAKFDFGDDNMVNMMGHELESTLTGIHYLQITDNRSDIHGWDVRVSRTEFEDKSTEVAPATGEKRTLAATLTLPVGEARNSMTGAALSTELTHSSEALEIPVVDAGGAGTSIFGTTGLDESGGKIGKATSTYVWDASQERLSVGKGESKTGNFESTINWTLTAEVTQ